MAYLILGNSAAGIAAAERIRQIDRNNSITILSDEPHAAYSRCLTSYYLGGQVTEQDMFLRANNFYQAMGISFQPKQKAVAVKPDKKQVVTDQDNIYSYDKLLIATGASANRPSLPGLESDGVFSLRTMDDAKAIGATCQKGRQAVVLGGGLVSLKVAAALYQRGMNVTVLVGSNRVMSQNLGDTAAGLVEEQLARMGITVKKGTRPVSVESDADGTVTGVKLHNGDFYQADLVIVGKGVRPNSSFLKETGLVNEDCEPLKVNPRQETALKDIYAAGDVALTYNIIDENYSYSAIWPNALEQGAAAGTNMAGLAKKYPGSIPMNSASFGGVPVIAAGITQPGAEGCAFMEDKDAKGNYRMLVLDAGRLVGFTLFGDTARAGLYTGIIKSRKQFQSNQILWQKPRNYLSLTGISTYQ